jgi:hypothetical protein
MKVGIVFSWCLSLCVFCHSLAMEHKAESKIKSFEVVLDKRITDIILSIKTPHGCPDKVKLAELYGIIQKYYSNEKYDEQFRAMKLYRDYIARKNFSNKYPMKIKYCNDRFIFYFKDMQEHFCITPVGGWRMLLWNGRIRPFCVASGTVVRGIKNHWPEEKMVSDLSKKQQKSDSSQRTLLADYGDMALDISGCFCSSKDA